jgi:hypothetical protein
VTVFRWAMRHGAMILFLATLLIFIASFANYFFFSGAALNRALSEEGLTNSKFVLFWGSIAQGLNNSVWSFLGACLLYRLDQHWGGEGPRK